MWIVLLPHNWIITISKSSSAYNDANKAFRESELMVESWGAFSLSFLEIINFEGFNTIIPYSPALEKFSLLNFMLKSSKMFSFHPSLKRLKDIKIRNIFSISNLLPFHVKNPHKHKESLFPDITHSISLWYRNNDIIIFLSSMPFDLFVAVFLSLSRYSVIHGNFCLVWCRCL